MEDLMTICGTNRNGTSTKNMIRAINKLGLSALVVEYATLHHLQSALKYPASEPRAAIVSYLYDLNEKADPHPESGHWATVAAYSSAKSRIVLLDSATRRKKSYRWSDFRNRWVDYDLKRRKVSKRGRKFRLVRNWQNQLLIVISTESSRLPKFQIETAKLFTP